MSMMWEQVSERFKNTTWGDGQKLEVEVWKDLCYCELQSPEWAVDWIEHGYPDPPQWLYMRYGFKTVEDLHLFVEGVRDILEQERVWELSYR